MSKQCPHCNLTNPAHAVRCDCGYDFATGQMSAPPVKKRLTKTRVLVVLLIVSTIAACVWLFTSDRSPVAFVIGLQHAINEHERILLYRIDHAALAQIMRELAQERRWTSTQVPRSKSEDPLIIDGSDPSLPPAARLMKPSHVVISDDHIEFEFGGAFLHFGIRTYRPGVPGEGNKRLGDGVWFFSEDGRVPSE
jgi:hypothetical protein